MTCEGLCLSVTADAAAAHETPAECEISAHQKDTSVGFIIGIVAAVVVLTAVVAMVLKKKK